jgi:hypothetical protein
MKRHCKLRLLSGLTACALTVAGAGSVRADLIDTTPTWNGTSGVSEFGNVPKLFGGKSTIGETFTTGAVNTTLNSFTFYLNDYQGKDGNTAHPVTFQAYVMAWNGTSATGPVLYTSPVETASTGGMQPFTFSTNGLQLNPNQQYVAFISVSGDTNSKFAGAKVGAVKGNPYSGGELVSLNNGNNFSAVTSSTWKSHPKVDAAFQANLSDPPANSSPAPGGLTLGLFGCGSLLGWSWRRRRQS